MLSSDALISGMARPFCTRLPEALTWVEWAEMLGAFRARGVIEGAADTGETYYQDWLAALERMVTAKGLAEAAALRRTRDAWGRAAERTPHGAPIELGMEDFC